MYKCIKIFLWIMLVSVCIKAKAQTTSPFSIRISVLPAKRLVPPLRTMKQPICEPWERDKLKPADKVVTVHCASRMRTVVSKSDNPSLMQTIRT